MILPSRADGFIRRTITDSTEEELDVLASYANQDEGLIALVYIYRTMTPDVPLWFDRTLATAELPRGEAEPAAIAAFARPGATVESGLRVVATDSVSGMRSTAIAIAPLGTWLVKIRLGSTRLDPVALDQRLSTFIAALRWPAETGTPTAVAPIAPCPTPLRLRNARIVRTGGADALIDAVAGSITPGHGNAGPPPIYCREPGATAERGVYRPNRATNSYLIALNDAGIALSVGEALDLSSLLGGGGSRRRYAVTLLERNSSSVYPSFDRLPPPDQALSLVRDASSPLSVTVGGREGN